ncbi:MAG: LysR family transcriptional regulator [Aquabacterium sp.]
METIAPRFDWAMTFLAIAELGSFTKAAERLGCSKAYASKQVSALEEALSVKLLHRTTRQVRPTETGLLYLDYCRRLRETLSEAERVVSNQHGEVAGRVKMSVPTTFGIEFMCDFIVSLHAAYPAIEIDLDLSTELRDLVDGRYDLALRLSPTVADHLIAKPLGVVADWVVISPALAQRHARIAHPLDLQGLPCLCNSHFDDDGQWLFIRGRHSEVVQVGHWARMNNYPLMRRAALADVGLAKLPAYLVQHDVAAGRLHRVLADWELPHKPVYLVFPDQRPLPRKVRAVIDHFSEWYQAGQGWKAVAA